MNELQKQITLSQAYDLAIKIILTDYNNIYLDNKGKLNILYIESMTMEIYNSIMKLKIEITKPI